MIKSLIVLILFIFLIKSGFCECNKTQVDLNLASIEELDRIISIGPVIAQRIVESRPFNSVEELIKVKGIGNITLDKIKKQNLACISNQTGNILKEEKENLSIKKENSSKENLIKEEDLESKDNSFKRELIELEKIILNSKDIKSEENKEILKRKQSIIGIILLIGFVGILLLLKIRKKKNELA